MAADGQVVMALVSADETDLFEELAALQLALHVVVVDSAWHETGSEPRRVFHHVHQCRMEC